MVELVPCPLATLAERLRRERAERGTLFDLEERSFWRGPGEGRDLGVSFHGRRAATGFGPAAGPHSQMAQNLVLAWLAGARVLELKTVQVNDRLVIPRPCIDMQTAGFNVEWSQELRLAQSLEEYVKGAMLVEVLAALGVPGLDEAARETIWDMSVGYDLAGIRSEGVRAFLAGMLDCRASVARLRRELPPSLRGLPFPERLSRTLTLSTFHGCPPAEIERIVEHLQDEWELDVVVKLNPMLLGPKDCRAILNERLGWRELQVPDSAFERDTRWEEALGFVERLRERARARGLGFGIKLTNTLIVENHRDFFPPDQQEMYLSGKPLHVLAMELVRRFRRAFGASLPISFSAGIERRNFADALALGLVPVTVCSDLLEPGGYARGAGYLAELERRMEQVGARTIEEWIVRAHGLVGSAEEALLASTERYVDGLLDDPRYKAEGHRKPPRKLGTKLALFDCVSCDKCVPVCPNDANFSFAPAAGELPRHELLRIDGAWVARELEARSLERERQWGTFADFCNECGNCDVFCPEEGGPYLVKPLFFGSAAAWRAQGRDGFALEVTEDGERLLARIDGREHALRGALPALVYEGRGFRLELETLDPPRVARGEGQGPIDLGPLHVMLRLREAVYAPGSSAWPALVARA